MVNDQNQEWWSCSQVTEYLGVTLNNLRQLQHRGRIQWKKRVGRNVYYIATEVQGYGAKRKTSKQG